MPVLILWLRGRKVHSHIMFLIRFVDYLLSVQNQALVSKCHGIRCLQKPSPKLC